MKNLHDTLAEKIPQWRSEIRELLEKNGNTVISTITLEQLLKGMRGVNAVLCDTSYVDPEEGLFIRGLPMLSLMERSAEEIFFLLYRRIARRCCAAAVAGGVVPPGGGATLCVADV